MTYDNTPDFAADATTAGGEAAPAPVRRRRATRTVAAPVTPEQSASTPAPATAGVTAAEPAATAAPAATGTPDAPEQVARTAPAARRSRRATRPAAEGAPSAAGRVATEAPDGADVTGGPAATAEPAPVLAAAQKDEPQKDATEKPAKAPRRRRATSRSLAAAEGTTVSEETPAAPEAVAVEDEDEAEEAPAAPVTRTGAPALDVLAELAGTAAPTEQARTAPRTATTALLFQAPDPVSRPRRRRAQVQAGSPEEISEAARRAEAAAQESDAQEAAVRDAAAREVAVSEDISVLATEPAPEAPARSSRRRGGRRRGELVTEAAVAEDSPEAPADEELGEVPGAGLGEPVEDEDALTSEADEEGEAADEHGAPRRRRRRGGRGRRGRTDGASDEQGEESAGEPGDEPEADEDTESEDDGDGAEEGTGSSRRRRRRRRGSRSESGEGEQQPSRSRSRGTGDEVTALRGSTRLEAKRQRRREGRDAGRRRQIISEAEFLARREAVDRTMIVRERDGRTQIAVLEDKVLVEHYVSIQAQSSMVGNVYLGRVQNVLPSMEAAFVDVGKGRNAVLYAGEVNWDAAGLEGGQSRRIEQALKSGDSVLVQVTKDPIGHKGARLTSQVTLAGRYLVYVPGGGMTGISRKLPDTERSRLKKILREVVPDSAGVIVRTAAEGASEEELRADIERLQSQWEAISAKAKTASAPALLQGEPDMAIRVVRDIFNDDFNSLVVQGDEAWSTISGYIGELAPDLADKVSRWTGTGDVFSAHRIDEQLAKGMDRKVWLPSGGSLVIDRTEAMTVIDVNTGKFTGSGGTLEETVTRNNIEAAEEIVRQLRLRDIGGIIVIDFIDMVLESNRDLVLRRLVECLGRDRTKHQVAEVTSLGLVQMTRKRVGQGLVEAFSVTCEHCHGRGFIVQDEPVEKGPRPEGAAPASPQPVAEGESKRARRKRGGAKDVPAAPHAGVPVLPEAREAVKATLATIAAAAAHAHEHEHEHEHETEEHEQAAALTEAEAAVEVLPAAVDASVEEEQAAQDEQGDVVVEVGDVAPAPLFDVLAELAQVTAARGDQAVASGEPADEEQLELTPVAPELFAVDDDEESDSPQ
ncbi:Rne/Rng family ribonuclease [Cellulomonas soli]|uniref:Rne/Rng family ribonuclease n=1 Tax=Cellulomonas soli TaxID=931535 RepID=UPI003F87E9FA